MEIDLINKQPVDLSKYRECSRILNAAMEATVRDKCHVGATVADICAYGDGLMLEMLAEVYKQGTIEKGLSLPCCVNINNVIGNCSPLLNDSKLVLCDGDLVKIEMGVHIDGYVVECGKSVVVCEQYQEPIRGSKADVICAAYLASELIVSSIQPGMTSQDIYQIIEDCAAAFHVSPVVGIHCAATTRFIKDHPQKSLVIDYNDEEKRHLISNQSDFTVEQDEVYIVTVGMSSGSGKVYPCPDTRTTMYQRNVDKRMCLKLQSARMAFEAIQGMASVFPFSIRDLPPRMRLGLQECVQKELYHSLPMWQDRPKTVVAQFKTTVFLPAAAGGSRIRLTEPKIAVPYVQSQYELPAKYQQCLPSTSRNNASSSMDMDIN